MNADRPAAICVRNCQRARHLNVPLLRRMATTLVRDLMKLDRLDLGIFLVDAARITRLNETFLHHAGPTDVITFDYAEEPPSLRGGPAPAGAAATWADCRPGPYAEVFACVEEAAVQARRFGTTWQSELVRYIVHGILHLRGFDDSSPGPRRRMKKAEDRCLRQLARRFELDRLGRQNS